MKFDFESLSAEPLFYMLMHSGAFVTVLGFIFFIIGLLFGYATWGRYKRQTRELRGEAASMKAEIADLKRKVGDNAVKSGPAIAMATETIYMPKREGGTIAEAVPAMEPPAAEPAMAESTMFPAELPSVQDEFEAADESSEPAFAGLVPADMLPALTELSMTPLPAVEIQPVVDPKLGLIYQSQPKETDDLTALKGIGLVLEKRLQEFGIYTYAQIAAWDEDQIKEFSSRLAFKDRIQRENWVEQARQMAATQTLAEVM